MASRKKILSKINSVRVYRSRLSVSKVLVMSFPVFLVPAIRRDLSVELTRIGVAFAIFCDKVESKTPFSSALCSTLCRPRRSLRHSLF